MPIRGPITQRQKLLAGTLALLCATAPSLASGAPGKAAASKCSGAMQSPDTYASGVQEFLNGNYKSALPLFEQAAAQQPRNAEIHYYLGNTLTCLRDYARAKQEYELCLALNPPVALATNARVALNMVAAPGASAASRAGRISTPLPVAKATPRAQLQDNDEHSRLVQQALSNMDEQARLDEKKRADIKSAMAEGWKHNQEREEARVKARLQNQLNELEEQWKSANTRSMSVFAADRLMGRQWRADVEQQMAQAKHQAENDIGLIRAEVDHHRQEYAAEQDKKNDLMHDSKQNIERQIQENTSVGGFGMKPLGTNIYSRYYGEVYPTKNLPPPHGSVARVFPNQLTPPSPNFTSGKDPLLPKQVDPAQTEVKGSLFQGSKADSFPVLGTDKVERK